MSLVQKLDWLELCTGFVITAEIMEVYEIITTLANYHQPLGQQSTFLLSGPSKSGKTSLLQYLVCCNPPYELDSRTINPIAMFDSSPFETTRKALAHRLIEGGNGLYNLEEREESC
jgi:hypothetical protein